MLPPELLVPRKPVRRRRLRLTSPTLNLLSVALTFLVPLSAGLLLAGKHMFPAPSKSYPLHKTQEVPTKRELILLTATGKPFARRGGCFDAPVTIEEVPRHFIDALLAMEDRRFYSHLGMDPRGVLRAALFNYKAKRIVQGGSTITQQLAKISYLSSAKSYGRKVEEAVIALRLEFALTKDQILERYLSRAYFGKGCYGLRAAARHYFDRPVGKLTLSQSAHLVALLKSPTELAGNLDALSRRERLVLQAMVEDGRLSTGELDKIEPAVRRPEKERPSGAYYADWIADTVKLPSDGDMTPLPVRTSFDPKLQSMAERAMANVMRKSARGRKASQAALVAMRPDGRVVALVGGVDHKNSQFNRATQALRQPGSSFKSFVYLAALRAGATPDMLASDEPITIGDWSPENYSHRYRGIVTLQQAFSSSINTVAVRLSEAVGRADVVNAARDLGISTPLRPGPSIALGTSEVTLLQLTSAYAAFAADAYPVKPWGIVSLGGGQQGPARPPKGAGKWRLTAGATMRQFLSATVQHGTGRAARLPIPSYGKTGTSQNYRDAWFIGFAGNLVVGVWVGNDDNSPMRRVTGGNLPTLIWRDFMTEARRKDRGFKPGLQRVAAFRAARPNHYSVAGYSGFLGSSLMGTEPQVAGWYADGDPRGHWLFGRQFYEERNRGYRNRERRRGRRSNRSWSDFGLDGS
ncbi:MAG: transglycosylase domain-containing protein [Methyloligellaceae bacterium]